MAINQRQKDIVDLVNLEQKVSVKFLAESLFYSEMTIRRDLIKLELEGYLKRCHGGAMAMLKTEQYPIEERMRINEKEKRNIAKLAEKYLSDNQTVFLPGFSTGAYLLPLLKNFQNLHVITNSIDFLTVLTDMRISCTICGGEYYPADKILIGRAAESFLQSINYDVAFLGCDGIDENERISVMREDSAQLFRICQKNAAKKIIIADHSKLSSKCKYVVGNISDADAVIVV